MKITRDMWMEEILEKFPISQDFLSKQGIVCVRCGEPVWGSLEELMKDKGFSEEEIDENIIQLNKYVEENEGKAQKQKKVIDYEKI